MSAQYMVPNELVDSIRELFKQYQETEKEYDKFKELELKVHEQVFKEGIWFDEEERVITDWEEWYRMDEELMKEFLGECHRILEYKDGYPKSIKKLDKRNKIFVQLVAKVNSLMEINKGKLFDIKQLSNLKYRNIFLKIVSKL